MHMFQSELFHENPPSEHYLVGDHETYGPSYGNRIASERVFGLPPTRRSPDAAQRGDFQQRTLVNPGFANPPVARIQRSEVIYNSERWSIRDSLVAW